jgi:aryl-phospho-beta-D-glucosidase BglC (GH1 family)
VNLGGWLVLEPFISPALYQKYPTAMDEWTLSVAMAADTGPGGGIGQLEEHYKTFIVCPAHPFAEHPTHVFSQTEEDFAQIAGAGLNWIRLPIPYWAIDVWPGEPFLSRTCWTYVLKAFDWARKYGLRIFLDLHTAPGSQSG